jgi:hypothetical protein
MTLMTETVSFFEMVVDTYQAIHCSILETAIFILVNMRN